MFHSSATKPEASVRPLMTDFRIDWKIVACPTLTGRPPLVGITPRAARRHAGEVMSLALWLCYEMSHFGKMIASRVKKANS